MKRLLSCGNLVEAHHYANLLRAAGVYAEVRNIYLSGAMGDVPFLETSPQVWIHAAQDEAEAHSIITIHGRQDDRPGWRCIACGEWIEGQFTQCWRCGADRSCEEDSGESA